MHSNGDPAQPKMNTFLKSAREDVARRAPSCSADGNVKWCSHYGEQYGDSLKNQSSYVIQHISWAYIQTKTIIQKDTCTPVFITALFTVVAKTWKQPKWPLTEKWKRCGAYIQWNIIQP